MHAHAFERDNLRLHTLLVSKELLVKLGESSHHPQLLVRTEAGRVELGELLLGVERFLGVEVVGVDGTISLLVAPSGVAGEGKVLLPADVEAVLYVVLESGDIAKLDRLAQRFLADGVQVEVNELLSAVGVRINSSGWMGGGGVQVAVDLAKVIVTLFRCLALVVKQRHLLVHHLAFALHLHQHLGLRVLGVETSDLLGDLFRIT